jgi:hypothetical protein
MLAKINSLDAMRQVGVLQICLPLAPAQSFQFSVRFLWARRLDGSGQVVLGIDFGVDLGVFGGAAVPGPVGRHAGVDELSPCVAIGPEGERAVDGLPERVC